MPWHNHILGVRFDSTEADVTMISEQSGRVPLYC